MSVHFVIQGRQNKGSKSEYKNSLKEELLQKQKIFQTIVGHNKIGTWYNFLTSKIIRGGK